MYYQKTQTGWKKHDYVSDAWVKEDVSDLDAAKLDDVFDVAIAAMKVSISAQDDYHFDVYGPDLSGTSATFSFCLLNSRSREIHTQKRYPDLADV